MISFLDKFMIWSNEHGLWDMIMTVVVIGGAIVGYYCLFWAKRRVRNLNFYTEIKRNQYPNYTLVIYLEIRNYTGRSVVISSPYFNYQGLRPDPKSRGDLPSGEYEIKFPNSARNTLTEVEFLLRNKENVSTWVPIDPEHNDTEVKKALKNKAVGKFYCVCTWLEEKPRSHKLRRSI